MHYEGCLPGISSVRPSVATGCSHDALNLTHPAYLQLCPRVPVHSAVREVDVLTIIVATPASWPRCFVTGTGSIVAPISAVITIDSDGDDPDVAPGVDPKTTRVDLLDTRAPRAPAPISLRLRDRMLEMLLRESTRMF